MAQNIQTLVGPNPGPLTFRGTNTYILGDQDQIVIDPGPNDPQHIAAIVAAAPNIRAICVTHSHIDHTAGVPALKAACGVPVYAYGDSWAGRDHLPDLGHLFAEGKGTDMDFIPDHKVQDQQVIAFGDLSLTCHWTPGHFPNHLCFGYGDSLISGDVVMGWSTTLISPPEGNVSQFRQSCTDLIQLPYQTYYPGHGDPVPDGAARAQDLLDHRADRDQQILQALEQGPATATALAERVYTDIAAHLLPAAARNVLAHLLDNLDRGNVDFEGELHPNAIFVSKR